MIKKLTLALLFTLPSLSFAVDLGGFYITAKGGISKTSNTGVCKKKAPPVEKGRKKVTEK